MLFSLRRRKLSMVLAKPSLGMSKLIVRRTSCSRNSLFLKIRQRRNFFNLGKRAKSASARKGEWGGRKARSEVAEELLPWQRIAIWRLCVAVQESWYQSVSPLVFFFKSERFGDIGRCVRYWQSPLQSRTLSSVVPSSRRRVWTLPFDSAIASAFRGGGSIRSHFRPNL